MTLGAVKAGDIVLADRKGRRFFAVVTERRDRELHVEPIDRRVTYHVVKGARGDRDLAQEPCAERQRGPCREVVGMSSQSNGDRGAVTERMVLVCVEDTIDPALAGHAGGVYRSPPQSPEQALELVGLLVGRPVKALADQTSWTVPVAGGRRIVTIRVGR